MNWRTMALPWKEVNSIIAFCIYIYNAVWSNRIILITNFYHYSILLKYSIVVWIESVWVGKLKSTSSIRRLIWFFSELCWNHAIILEPVFSLGNARTNDLATYNCIWNTYYLTPTVILILRLFFFFVCGNIMKLSCTNKHMIFTFFQGMRNNLDIEDKSCQLNWCSQEKPV